MKTTVNTLEKIKEHLIGKTKAELDNIETHGDGYVVEYEDGYVSWSPKATFERAYRRLTVQEKNLIV